MTDLSLEQLQTRLQQDVRDQALALVAGQSGAPRIDAFLASLPGGRLELQGVDIAAGGPAQPGTLRVAGQATVPWAVLGLHGAEIDPGRITLTYSQSAIGAPISASLQTDGALQGPFPGIPLAGQLNEAGSLHLALAPQATPRLPLGTIAAFATGDRMAQHVPLDLPSFTDLLVDSLDMQLGIASSTHVQIQLSAGLEWQITSGVSLRKVATSLAVTYAPARSGRLSSVYSLTFITEVSIGAGVYQAAIAFPGGTTCAVTLSSRSSSGLPGLADLADFAGGVALRQAMESGLQATGLDHIAVDRVTILFDWKARQLVHAMVDAHILLHGARLDLAIQLPRLTLTGALSQSTPLALSDLLDGYFGASVGLPAVVITAADFAADPEHGRYALSTTIDDVFAMGPLQVDSMTLEIQRTPDGVTGGMTALVTVAGTQIRVLATRSSSPDPVGGVAAARSPTGAAVDGWYFEGRTEPGQTIPMGRLLDDLGQRFGVSAPDAVQSLVLQNLHFGYALATGGFLFEVEGDFTLASVPVVMTVAIDVAPNPQPAKGYTGSFAGTIAMMGLRFAVDLSTAGNKLVSLAFPDMKLGDALGRLVALIDPNFQLDVGFPWSAILDFDLSGKALVFDATAKSISLTATSGDLAHVDLFGLASTTLAGITYTKGQSLKISGSYQVTGLDPQALDWDPVNQPPPALPAAAPRALDVRYLGLGQHVALTTTSDLTSVGKVIEALRQVPVAQDPTTSLHDLKFDASAGWLIGFDLSIKGAIRVAAIFNDPVLYGLQISLSGGLVGKLDGLSFEILYRKIADGLGLYHIDLLLPLLMRHLEFGSVSLTLPHVIVDIYTNGNFLVDFGFPYERDFSRSMMIEVFPFVGAGGFYFGVLDSSTSNLVPTAQVGSFQPVIAFGLGLQVGLGKTFEAGPLSAGITITVEGILEGVLAFWKHGDASETYFKLSGTVAISAHVWGSVDFVIVSASIDIYVFAAVQLVIESHAPIFLELSAGVSVSASARVCGLFTVHFHFSTTIHESFTIGSTSQAPWQLS